MWSGGKCGLNVVGVVCSEGLHAYEILPVPYPVIPWASIKPEHKPLNFRIDDSESLLTPSYFFKFVNPLHPSSRYVPPCTAR